MKYSHTKWDNGSILQFKSQKHLWKRESRENYWLGTWQCLPSKVLLWAFVLCLLVWKAVLAIPRKINNL